MSFYSSLFSAGPYGEGDDEQVFVQRVIPDSDTIFVRLSSTGERYGYNSKNTKRM